MTWNLVECVGIPHGIWQNPLECEIPTILAESLERLWLQFHLEPTRIHRKAMVRIRIALGVCWNTAESTERKATVRIPLGVWQNPAESTERLWSELHSESIEIPFRIQWNPQKDHNPLTVMRACPCLPPSPLTCIHTCYR